MPETITTLFIGEPVRVVVYPGVQGARRVVIHLGDDGQTVKLNEMQARTLAAELIQRLAISQCQHCGTWENIAAMAADESCPCGQLICGACALDAWRTRAAANGQGKEVEHA